MEWGTSAAGKTRWRVHASANTCPVPAGTRKGTRIHSAPFGDSLNRVDRPEIDRSRHHQHWVSSVSSTFLLSMIH